MSVLKFTALYFVCMSLVCGSSFSQTKKSAQTRQSDKPELTVVMQKNADFFGSGPVYKLTVQPDGKVIFEGIKNTKTHGKAESNLSIEKMNQLAAEINKAKFFSLKNSYNKQSGNCPEFIYDAASVTISIKLKKKEKKIEHNLGCSEAFARTLKSFPPQLNNLENKIDEIVAVKRWTEGVK